MNESKEMKMLQEPFLEDEYEWRVHSCGISNDKPWVLCLTYVTNRAIQNRLDDTFGPFGWRNEFQKGPEGGVICGLSIWDQDKTQWITKWDGAPNTDIEEIKGGLSDSMKRAAVQWGIGRFLYTLKENFAECSLSPVKGWKKALDKKNNKTIWWNPPVLPMEMIKGGRSTPKEEPQAPAAPPAKKKPDAKKKDETDHKGIFASALKSRLAEQGVAIPKDPGLYREFVYYVIDEICDQFWPDDLIMIPEIIKAGERLDAYSVMAEKMPEFDIKAASERFAQKE